MQRIKQCKLVVITVSGTGLPACTSGGLRTFHSWPFFALTLYMFVIFALSGESSTSTSCGAPLGGQVLC